MVRFKYIFLVCTWKTLDKQSRVVFARKGFAKIIGQSRVRMARICAGRKVIILCSMVSVLDYSLVKHVAVVNDDL